MNNMDTFKEAEATHTEAQEAFYVALWAFESTTFEQNTPEWWKLVNAANEAQELSDETYEALLGAEEAVAFPCDAD